MFIMTRIFLNVLQIIVVYVGVAEPGQFETKFRIFEKRRFET